MKRVMFYSTLYSPSYWAGCEKFWYDFVSDERVCNSVRCHILLGDSSITRERGKQLAKNGVSIDYYTRFTENFVKRNAYRVVDKILKRSQIRAPWFDKIREVKPDLAFFTAVALKDVILLEPAVEICQSLGIPYWIVLQHADENFFLNTKDDLNTFASIFKNAKRSVFISEKNKHVTERAIGEKLSNAFMSVNGLTADFFERAGKVAVEKPVKEYGDARFINLARFSLLDKGQHLLFEALSSEKWRKRQWTLALIGAEGEVAEMYIPRWTKFYHLPAERIEVGKVSDVLGAIGKSDLLILPSLAEGTPFALAESMACGRPAVGTPVGGIPELISEGETGWLADSATAKHVDEALERAWKARNFWREVGNKARDIVLAKYNLRNSIENLLKVLKDDLENS